MQTAFFAAAPKRHQHASSKAHTHHSNRSTLKQHPSCSGTNMPAPERTPPSDSTLKQHPAAMPCSSSSTLTAAPWSAHTTFTAAPSISTLQRHPAHTPLWHAAAPLKGLCKVRCCCESGLCALERACRCHCRLPRTSSWSLSTDHSKAGSAKTVAK